MERARARAISGRDGQIEKSSTSYVARNLCFVCGACSRASRVGREPPRGWRRAARPMRHGPPAGVIASEKARIICWALIGDVTSARSLGKIVCCHK